MPQIPFKVIAAALLVVVFLETGRTLQAQPAGAAPGAENAAKENGADDSPLLIEPKTPDELFEATLLMLRLGRPELARRYLQTLMDADPDDATLLELREKYGPDSFLRLARAEALRPLSSRLLERMNRAFRRFATDPARIDRLITGLSGTPDERQTAMISLRDTGPIVVPRMLQHIADPELGGQRDAIIAALVRMGEQAVPPLVAGLESPSVAVRTAVIEVLGWVGSREIVPYLFHPAFAEDQPPSVRAIARQALARIYEVPIDTVENTAAVGVAGELAKHARRLLRGGRGQSVRLPQAAAIGTVPEAGTDEGDLSLWVWQPDSNVVALTRVSPELAALYVGSRFARQAFQLAPERRDLQALYLASMLAYEAHRTGAAQPVPTGPGTAYNLALTAGPEVATQALSEALSAANSLGAVAALQALSQIGTRRQLYKTAAEQSPIVAALNYPNLRVQFAAASTILQLDPQKSFRGAPRVVEIMARALQDDIAPHGLVVHPDVQQATTIAGLLGQFGYEPLIAPTGREAFRIATERRDIALILLHVNTIRWPLSLTIANLRADARTAAIPIAIYGPESVRPGVEPLLERYPLVTYLIESSTAENLEVQLRPFLESLRGPALTPEQRVAQKAAAAYWLAHIAAGRRTELFDLAPAEDALVAAGYDATLAPNVLQALAAIPSKRAQRQLQIIAANPQTAATVREMAALQLAFHIQRQGLLLDDRQVAAVKSSWRAETDPGLKTALASVVGSLGPNRARTAERLRESPPAAPPVSAPPPAATER